LLLQHAVFITMLELQLLYAKMTLE